MTAETIGRVCGAALEAAYFDLDRRSTPNLVSLIGGIITLAGFPEIGIPIGIAGYVMARIAEE
jgi:hypothetical protein